MEGIELNDSKSLYNEGLLQIQRLSNGWSNCNYYSKNGLMSKWRWELDVIWRELSYDNFKLAKSKNLKDYWVNDSVKSMNELNIFLTTAFRLKNGHEIYRLLNEKEITLRILQHKVGKGAKYEDDDVRDIE